jgi:hypothetical protein
MFLTACLPPDIQLSSSRTSAISIQPGITPIPRQSTGSFNFLLFLESFVAAQLVLFHLAMTALKKVFRILAISSLIVLAATGAGMAGAFLPNTRERYMDKEILIEQVDKKRAEEEENDEVRNPD